MPISHVETNSCLRCIDGLVSHYRKTNQCAGCGYAPLDFSAWDCPKCHRSEDLHRHVVSHKTTCQTCVGTGKILHVTRTERNFFGLEYKTFERHAATPQNIALFTPKREITYHYNNGTDQYVGTVNQLIALIKQNPHGTHRIYFNESWCDASTLTPFNQYIPKKSAPKKTKPIATKNTTPKKSTPKKSTSSRSSKKSNTRKPTKPEKPKPNLTYPFKETKYDALCDGLSSISGRFPYIDKKTDAMRESLRALFKEWRNGIDITKRSQPKLDRAIALIYALPERYLMLILDDLEAIEQNKHLVSKQRKSSYQALQKDTSHYIYPRSTGSLHPLYSTLEDIREQFMKLSWPGKTGILGDQIAAFLEEWDDGIDPTKESHYRLDAIVTTLYSLKDYLLIKIITNLEHIEQHKHSIVNHKKRQHSQKRSPQPSQTNAHKNKRERFSARLLHEEIMDGNNGWLLELPTSILQTDNGKWNESRIGVVAKVLREYDSRVSFNLFLKWCQKYGNSDDLMLPILSKKKKMEDLFRQIWISGQFKEEEFKGELFLKGSAELIQLKVN